MKPNPIEDDPFQGGVPKTAAEMTPAERLAADEYRRRKTSMSRTPTNFSKRVAIGSWVSGIAIAGWLVLYEDWGPRDNVFTDLRKHYHKFMKDMFNLSPRERSIIGRSDRGAPVKVDGQVIYPSTTDRQKAGIFTDEELAKLEVEYGLRENDGKPA